ncbi:MAG: hypothetical protein E6Q97_37855 [Desulfurellales bacterium]|nr:MAG: hypothetical protein E6Q97_37855 [Desulfurellales bacterium]
MINMTERVKNANPGDMVRYLFAHRMHGVLVRKSWAHGGSWYVKWENGQTLTAAHENLELIDTRGQVTTPGGAA